MSGPFAETAEVHVRTTATAAHWPLALKGDGIGCPECGSGLLTRPSLRTAYLELAELMALVEQHATRCSGRRQS